MCGKFINEINSRWNFKISFLLSEGVSALFTLIVVYRKQIPYSILLIN